MPKAQGTITLPGQTSTSYGKGLAEKESLFRPAQSCSAPVPGRPTRSAFMTTPSQGRQPQALDTSTAAQEHHLCKHSTCRGCRSRGQYPPMLKNDRHNPWPSYIGSIVRLRPGKDIPRPSVQLHIIRRLPRETRRGTSRQPLEIPRPQGGGKMQLFTLIYSKRTGSPRSEVRRPPTTLRAEKHRPHVTRLLKTQE